MTPTQEQVKVLIEMEIAVYMELWHIQECRSGLELIERKIHALDPKLAERLRTLRDRVPVSH